MDELTIKSIIVEAVKKGDFSKIVELIPYQQRYELFTCKICDDLPDSIFSALCGSLFTPEEALTLFFQHKGLSKTNLFKMLTEADQLKYYDEVELTGGDATAFLTNLHDEEIKYKLFIKLLEEEKLWTFFMESYISMFNGEYQFKALDVAIETCAKKDNPISPFNFSSYIAKFSPENRFRALKYIHEKTNTEKFSCTYIDDALKLLPEEQRMEGLRYLLDRYLDEYKSYISDLGGVLNCFNDVDYFSVIDEYLNRGILKEFVITELYGKFDLNKCMEFIDYVLDYSIKNNIRILKASTISQLLDKLSREDGKKIYDKYAIDTDYFGNLSVAKACKNVEDSYFYLDYLISVKEIKDFDKGFDSINTTLADMPKVASGENEYPYILDMYAKKYNVDRIHLREFVKRFDYIALKFMNSKSIRDVINLSDENFVKFLNIFNHGTMLDNNIVNSICNSFLQRQFRLENKEDYTIFTQFELLIASNSDEKSLQIADLLVKVNQVVDIDVYLNRKGVSFDQFVADIMSSDKESIDLLHDMTQEYIMKRREAYVKKELGTVYAKLNMNRKADKNFYKRRLVEVSEPYQLRAVFSNIPAAYLTEEEKAFFDYKNREIFEQILTFKKDRTPIAPENKRYLKVFETLLNKAYDYNYESRKFDKMEDTVYVYSPKEPTLSFLLGVIVECNVKQIVEKVLSDKQVYAEMIALIDKYKLLGWDKTFAYFDESAEVTFIEGTMASIISNFYIINEIAKEKDANLTQFLDYANCYDSLSKMYSYILGRDNYRAISANEGKNKADMSRADRLGRLPRLITGMYDRTEITTPPIDKDYSTTSGKKMNVVLGNSTNMINLSYGERTNSCLRIGGAFNNLFEFCIHDKNGFHVRFTDPETGKFISRVSGIRNGNTIFFNELRDCEHPDYTNEELIEILHILSNELVEQTKHEECPIENVVITYDYAMRNYEEKAVPTGLKDYPNAFYRLRFNIPFDGKFVILKTTNPEGSLVPYKFGADLAQTYETQRDKIISITDKEKAFEKVAQLQLVDRVLKGYEVDEKSLEEISNIDMCMAGEDWYIYIDTEGNVHQFVVEMSKHKDRALEEMKKALEQIKDLVAAKQEVKAVGGLS